MSYLDRLHFLETPPEGTAKTDTTGVLSVLSVPPGALSEKRAPVRPASDPLVELYRALFEGQAARALASLEPADVRRAGDLGLVTAEVAAASALLAYRRAGVAGALIAVPRERYDGLAVLKVFHETTEAT